MELPCNNGTVPIRGCGNIQHMAINNYSPSYKARVRLSLNLEVTNLASPAVSLLF